MSLKKRKEKKGLLPRMNPMEERRQSNHLFVEGVPVWYSQNGRVKSEWLSACKEERTLTGHLMERICDPLNVTKACQRVVSNGGSSGVDGMKVEELKEWLGVNLTKLQEQLLTGIYQPQAVKGTEIPKPNGGKRRLGIPTVIDRLVQQSIHQVLSIGYEGIFSENSYGFRPGRSAQQAAGVVLNHLKAHRLVVVDVDLKAFFDSIPHERLLDAVRRRVTDGRVLDLIGLFLTAGVMEDANIHTAPTAARL